MQFIQILNSIDYPMQKADKYYCKGNLCGPCGPTVAPALVTQLLVSSNNALFKVLFRISVSVHLSCCIQDSIPCLIKTCPV